MSNHASGVAGVKSKLEFEIGDLVIYFYPSLDHAEAWWDKGEGGKISPSPRLPFKVFQKRQASSPTRGEEE